MPDALLEAKKAAEHARAWTERRDAAIRRAREKHSLREIAEATGLSHGTVDNIVKR